MPPVDRLKPTRGKSSESTLSLMEFMREFPDDNACLEWLWRTRYSEDGDTAHCPKCDRDRIFKALQDDAAAPVVDVYRLRPPRPPDRRDHLPQVLDLAAPVVLRDVPHH
jgi:hypothetical protein